jgi:hypothetical protein
MACSPRPLSPSASYRGLRIVDALALRWGFCADGGRTTVWAEFVADADA